MRKLRIFEHISLDGVIQVRGPGEDSDSRTATGPYLSHPRRPRRSPRRYGDSFDLLLGRRTYDIWSGFWPKAASGPMADAINAATKYIATHRPDSLEWGPFEGVGPDIVEDVRRIKSQGRPRPDPLGQFNADIHAARARTCG